MSYQVKRKSKLSKFLNFLFIVFIAVFILFLVKVVFSSAPETVNANTDLDAAADPAVIDEFVAGTYGGIKMDTAEDAVKYYTQAYNKTKAKTATYKNNETGEAYTWYDFLGEEDLSVGDVQIDGNTNAMINNLVPGIVGGLFQPSPYGLPPCTSRDPSGDKDENGESFAELRATVDDFIAVNVKDNGDGTITMSLQPKASEMSHRGMDSQGKFFNTLGAIDSTVEQISVLKWSEGTTAENCKVAYKGGYGVVTIDTKTGEITAADYDMEVVVNVQHASITVIKDKSASITVSYKMKFPASAEYISERVKSTKA